MVDAPAGELWVSQTELAAMKGVSPQAISKRMKRLEAEGLITPRRQHGKRVVSLAEWDSVTNETTDFSRVAGRATTLAAGADGAAGADVAAAAKADPTYTQELTRKARYDADLKALELKRQRSELVTVDDARESMALLGEAIARDVDQLATFAEDVHAAAAKGLNGTRDALRRLARDLRERFDRHLADVDYRTAGDADGAPDDERTAA